MKTRGIGLVAGLLSLFALSGGGRAAALPQRPNIIIVMPDDVGYGDYGCLGNPFIHTPAADAFYKESVRFIDFHVSPTCAPTRAALMTGRRVRKASSGRFGCPRSNFRRARSGGKARADFHDGAGKTGAVP